MSLSTVEPHRLHRGRPPVARRPRSEPSSRRSRAASAWRLPITWRRVFGLCSCSPPTGDRRVAPSSLSWRLSSSGKSCRLAFARSISRTKRVLDRSRSSTASAVSLPCGSTTGPNHRPPSRVRSLHFCRRARDTDSHGLSLMGDSPESGVAFLPGMRGCCVWHAFCGARASCSARKEAPCQCPASSSRFCSSC